jgi:hypothetical protein
MTDKWLSSIGKHFGEGVGAAIGAYVGGPQGAVRGAKLGKSIQQMIQGDSAPVNNDRTNAKEDPNYVPRSKDGIEGILEGFIGGGGSDRQAYGSYYYNPDGTKKPEVDDWTQYISTAASAAQLFA